MMSECYEEIMLFSHSDLIFHFIKRPEEDFGMALYPQTNLSYPQQFFDSQEFAPLIIHHFKTIDADNWKVPKFS